MNHLKKYIQFALTALFLIHPLSASTISVDVLHDTDPTAGTTLKQRLNDANPPAVLMISTPVKSSDSFFGIAPKKIKKISDLLENDSSRGNTIYTTTLKDTRDNTWYRIFYNTPQERSKLPTRADLHGSHAPFLEQVACVLKKFDIYFYAIQGYEYRLVMEDVIAQDLKYTIAFEMSQSCFAAENLVTEMTNLISDVKSIDFYQKEMTCRFWFK